MAGHPPRREPVSVLLAEHEPEVAEMSARYLRQDGLRVRLVTSPEPTLAELTGGPDAVAAGRQTAGDRAADVYVTQLRAKLGAAAQIRTVRGIGYALDPGPLS
mgnify:CR=1 FL=1